jgi:hypothetical protein
MGKRLTPRIITTGFLATTSALALLTGPAFAGSCGTLIPGGGFFDVGTLCPAVSNGGSIASIQITNSGAIGATLQTTHFVHAGSTFHSSVVNTGTIGPIPNINAVNVQSSTLIGSIVNTGTIAGSLAGGILINNSAVNTGGADAVAILNAGLIIAGEPGKPGIGITESTLTGAIVNGGTIRASGSGIVVSAQNSINASITNSGLISVSATPAAPALPAGISANSPSGTGTLVTGTIVNAGTINITQGSAVGAAFGISLDETAIFTGTIANGGQINVTAGASNGTAVGVVLGNGTLNGRMTNSGTITATAFGGSEALGIVGSGPTNGIDNAGEVSVHGGGGAGGIAIGTSFLTGGVTNTGTIAVSSAAGIASGLTIGTFGQAQLQNGITNSGTISATGALAGARLGKRVLRRPQQRARRFLGTRLRHTDQRRAHAERHGFRGHTRRRPGWCRLALRRHMDHGPRRRLFRRQSPLRRWLAQLIQ